MTSIEEYERQLFQGWPTDPHELRRQGGIRMTLARLYEGQGNFERADDHCQYAIRLLRDLPIPNEDLGEAFHLLYEIHSSKYGQRGSIVHLASAVNMSPPGSPQRVTFAAELRRLDPTHPLGG
jgi:hypothetical protein